MILAMLNHFYNPLPTSVGVLEKKDRRVIVGDDACDVPKKALPYGSAQFVEKVYHIKRRTFPRLPLTRELSPLRRLRER